MYVKARGKFYILNKKNKIKILLKLNVYRINSTRLSFYYSCCAILLLTHK